MNHTEQRRFLTARDVAEIAAISESSAYKLIRVLNSELSKEGFLVIRGRVPAKYFYERVRVSGGGNE